MVISQIITLQINLPGCFQFQVFNLKQIYKTETFEVSMKLVTLYVV